MHTVTFYSYKGGVGRTLVVANVAKYLSRLGMKVFILDFDLEAPGIPYKFASEDGRPLEVGRGLVDILANFLRERRLPDNISDYVVEVPSTTFATGTIHLLPAGDAPSVAYWRSLSSLDWHELFYSDRAEGIPVLLEVKGFIEETYGPDFLLVDARTGITEMGGVATTVLSDQVVCLTLSTPEHLSGTRGVMQAIRSAQRPEGAAQTTLVAALSRMPYRSPAEEAIEIERVKNFLNEPFDEWGSSLNINELTILHRDPLLEQREQLLVGGSVTIDDSSLLQDYVRLFVKLVSIHGVEQSIGRLIDDIQGRVMSAPDEAEQALEALARDCMHPESYTAVLRMYRPRRSSLSKRLLAAGTYCKITNNFNEPLLWDSVKDYEPLSAGDSFDASRAAVVEGIWAKQHPEDARLALVLSQEYEAEREQVGSIRALETNVASDGATAEVVARLIRLLWAAEEYEKVERLIARQKERMCESPVFLEAWAEHALQLGSREDLRKLVLDPAFNSEILEDSRPGLVARLNLFKTGDRAEAKRRFRALELLQPRGLRSGRRVVGPHPDINQIGALARDLGLLEEFKKAIDAHVILKTSGVLDRVAGLETLPLEEFGEDEAPADEDIPF